MQASPGTRTPDRSPRATQAGTPWPASPPHPAPAYLRGDGPLAAVALEAALAEDPAHRMAGLLDTALQGGVDAR